MKILVLGATGRTGRLVVEEALRRGMEVSAIARDPKKLEEFKIRITPGTPYDYATVEKAMAGCSAVINTLNVSRKSDNPWAPLAAPKDLISRSAANAVKAMEKHGVKRIVALSTIGAGRSWKKSPLPLRMFVAMSNLRFAFRDHGRQEEVLENSGLDYTICRAPMLSNESAGLRVVATPEGVKPAGMHLSRGSTARFFLDIIEDKEHMGDVVHIANPKK